LSSFIKDINQIPIATGANKETLNKFFIIDIYKKIYAQAANKMRLNTFNTLFSKDMIREVLLK